jgi:serine/threonine-protein kinase
MPVLGATLNQRFLLEKELGRGGMGAVYRATDQVLQRTVAIKVLKELSGEEVKKRIRTEACILARLLHEHIVRLYDFGMDGETYYFIMEEVDGTSFQKRWKKIDLADRVLIIAQVAEALDYAHHQGVIHRDVKPANVLLTSKDQAKLSDFGLSVLSSETQESGIVRGTPHYMSPEQAKGKKINHRSDLYSIGVMIYECATGTAPYSGSMMSIMSQHVNATPELPRARNPELSPEFEKYILRLMARAAERRPASGRDVAADLRDLCTRRALLAPGATSSVSASLPAAAVAVAPPDSNNGPGSGGTPPSGRGPATGMGSAGASVSLEATPVSMGGTPTPMPAQRSATQARVLSAAARDLIDLVEAEPIEITPDERYLCGHYLAYFLGGSRRRGFLMRRPLDPLNADRARLLLGMTALATAPEGELGVARVASLFERRIDVRPALSPVVVMKYLACRDTPAKRKRFRQVRQQLQQASPYATKYLCDDQGVLNPGLMPQVLTDLRRLAPERTEIDDQLIQRWNRVTEVWRGNPEFRDAVLRYATKAAYLDAASFNLWPEVVYPLIERARWQRKLRPAPEVVLDAICQPLRIPDAGLRMDRAIRRSVPEQVAEKLDASLNAFVENPSLGEPEPAAAAGGEPEGARLTMHSHISQASFHELELDQPTRSLVRLGTPDPIRLAMGELRELWKEGITALRTPGAKPGHRSVPIGPYRLSVVASIRSRSAGQVAIQGMPNKQVEMLLPSFTGGGSASRLVLAVWVYKNNSVGITYIDHMSTQRYILWDASTAQQTNFETAAEFNHALFTIGLEVPDQLDRALSKSYRPKNPV